VAVIRVRRCLVRAVVHQPWLCGDPDALSAALTRLVTDVLAPRLAGQFDRVGQTAPLAAVAVRVTLPAQEVLGLAEEAREGPAGRRLASFGAELAVHAATSSAVRVAVERQAAGPGGPDWVPPGGTPQAQPAPAAGDARRPLALPGPETDARAAAADDRLPAAVRGTLLAAWRLDRLRHLLGRCDPALLAEWARLLSAQRAREPPAPSAAESVPVADADGPPFRAGDAAFEAVLDVLAATAGVRPRQLPPRPRETGASIPPTGTANAAGSPLALPGPEADARAAAADDRLPAAVRGTLLAAWRLDRLRHLLGRCDPALLAEWARLLPAQRARAPAMPPTTARSGGPEPSGLAAPAAPVAAGLPTRPSRPGPPPLQPRDAGAAVPPPGAAADAVFEAILDILAATAAPRRPPQPPHAGAATPPAGAAGGPAVEAILDIHAAQAARGQLPVGPSRPVAAAPARGPADTAVAAILDVLAAAAGTRPGQLPDGPAGAGITAPAAGNPAAPGPGRAEPAVNLELELASVLPFLLVGPLDELGVLDAVTAALAGPGWLDLLAAFAACLARKTLPPPAAGWLQPPEIPATVAAFTGRAHAPDGNACERLGQAVPRWWPVVQEAVTAELAGLRTEDAPLVATPSPGGLVLADADGLVPLLWDADADAARRLWESCGRPPVLVHPALAPAGLQALSPAPDRVHTRALAEAVALARRRPASGRPGLAPELEGPLSLLASVGLAALAWELWHRHGERTHPALAIERLADLSGRVRLGPDSVTVQMPIGRRHADLRDSGLLRAVDDVPWLQGRRLELLGG